MQSSEGLSHKVIGGNSKSVQDARVIFIVDPNHYDMRARINQALTLSDITTAYPSRVLNEGWPAFQIMPGEEFKKTGLLIPANANLFGWDDIDAFNALSASRDVAVISRRRSRRIMETDIYADGLTIADQIQLAQKAIELLDISDKLLESIGGELFLRRNVSLVASVQDADTIEPEGSKIVVIAGKDHIVGEKGVIDQLSRRCSTIVLEPIYEEKDHTETEIEEMLFRRIFADHQDESN